MKRSFSSPNESRSNSMLAILASGYLSGLTGSLHCIGMCGPITLAIPKSKDNPFKQITNISLYHIGRITTYMILGLIFSLIGNVINLFLIQQKVSLITGILIILIALSSIIFKKVTFLNPIYLKFNSSVQKAMSKFLRSQHPLRVFSLGLMNGLLPCAMSFMAIIASMGMGSIQGGVLFMFVFGLGTLPLMVLFSSFTSFLKRLKKGSVKQISLVLGLFLGIVLIFRGLNLGINFISPKLEYLNGIVVKTCNHIIPL